MSMNNSDGHRPPGGWHWPDDLLPEVSKPSSSANDDPSEPSSTTGGTRQSPAPQENESQEKKHEKPHKERHYKSRTCRICLETVLPTFTPPSENLPEMLQGIPSVKYESEGGRLISPCKCKGSSRYVHETCLQEWRHADPSYGRRNYWNCPTCAFQYRLGRLSWGHWLSSAVTQISLTVVIFIFAVFALGFVADPIINLYLDPLGTITSPLVESSYDEYYSFEDEEAGWAEHFFKGFASLGLVGFVKVFVAMGPWHWLNVRGFLGGGARNATTGRDRVANLSWIVVALGVATFLFTVWKGVRAWSRRVLEKASERVMDVGDGADDDDDED